MRGLKSALPDLLSSEAAPTIEDVLRGASLELDQLGLDIEQLRKLLTHCFDALPQEMTAAGAMQFHSLDAIAQRLHALAGVVGLLRPQLGPSGGVEEALASVSLAAQAAA